MIGASRAYALEERAAVKSFFHIELEDIEFSAARAVEWLNEHTNDVLKTTELYVIIVFPALYYVLQTADCLAAMIFALSKPPVVEDLFELPLLDVSLILRQSPEEKSTLMNFPLSLSPLLSSLSRVLNQLNLLLSLKSHDTSYESQKSSRKRCITFKMFKKLTTHLPPAFTPSLKLALHLHMQRQICLFDMAASLLPHFLLERCCNPSDNKASASTVMPLRKIPSMSGLQNLSLMKRG